MTTRDLPTRLLDFKARLLAPYNGLEVNWFDGWHPALDKALAELPEIETCPHDLFRLLLQNPGSAPKRIALVSERGTPVAVIPLRQLGRQYYEVPTWMIPGAVFPAKPGYLVPALEALGVEVSVAWRRMDSPPPSNKLLRDLKTTPFRMIRFSDEYERYWRDNGHFKTVSNKRNRCRKFNVAINSPGSAEWTIKRAAEKWRDDSAKTSRAMPEWAESDWILVADYWEKRKCHYTITLLDQGTLIGGASFMVHRNDAIGGLIYREPSYEWYGIGIRLLDLAISFSAELGLETIDFGGDADYKRHWAPEAGNLWHFKICPEALFRAKQLKSWMRAKPNGAPSES